jgi:CHAD domain-containing protein
MAILLDYWKKRSSKLKFLIRTPKRKFNQSRFHVLRVEIKKLKALLLLVEFHDREFNRKKFYKPFRSLFSQAGKVREFQIEKEILKIYGQNEAIPGFLKSLDRRIRKERKLFFEKRNLKLNSVLVKRLKSLKSKIRVLENADFEPYLAIQLAEIKLILAIGKLEESTGHLLRKKLKTLKYNLESIQRSSASALPPAQEGLVNLLGNWHDFVRVNQLLSEELGSIKIPPEELICLQQIRNKISLAIDEITLEINQKIHLFDDFVFIPK